MTNEHRPWHGRTARLTVLGTTAAMTLVGVFAGPAAAQDGTTTTLPANDPDLGHIIPRPNSGRAPRDAGDPGGWLQVSLFFFVCAVIIGIALYVWYRSHKVRLANKAAGVDRLSVARSSGKGLRPQPH